MTYPKPKRKRKKPIHISKIIRESVIQRDKGLCVLSGNPATEIHHCVYKSHSGNNTAKNLICLSSKSHREVHAQGKKYFPILFKILQSHYPDLKIEDMKK